MNLIFHSFNDKPAIVELNRLRWFKDGLLSREDGPAEIIREQFYLSKRYLRNGLLIKNSSELLNEGILQEFNKLKNAYCN